MDSRITKEDPTVESGREIFRQMGVVTTDLSDYLTGAFPRAPFQAKDQPDTCSVLLPKMDVADSHKESETMMKAIAADSAGQIVFHQTDMSREHVKEEKLELSINGKVIYGELWSLKARAKIPICQDRSGVLSKVLVRAE